MVSKKSKNLTLRDVSWAVANLKMRAKVTPREAKLLDKWVEKALK